MASVDVLKKELETLKLENNFDEPDRGNLDDESIKWRHGKPSYVKANLEFLKGLTFKFLDFLGLKNLSLNFIGYFLKNR